MHECPHCHSNYIVSDPQVAQIGKDDAKYDLLRGEIYLDSDAEVVPDTERPSEDILRPDADDQIRDGKGKAVSDV